ncbi:tail fiber domain-containing protein [Microcoleus sp. T3_B1]|uniref:tail fiber domain-containing protein n=1 Tax=Microcoleus sp. T3_B1 TaxID=3055425 RepID=UPI002FCEB2DC
MAPNEIDKEQEKAINQRPNYFAGQYLLEDDFQLEQKYHIDRQRRHNRLLHVSGIAEGLKVSLGEDKKVKVSAGTAIDSQGRQIILPDDQSVGLEEVANPKPLKNGEYTLSIRYEEELTEKQGSEDKTHRRVQEKPAFELSNEKSKSTTPDVIPLAKLTIKGGKVENEENIDQSVRQYSGICLPTEDGEGVTLRSHGAENQNLAILTGNLSISGTLAVTGKTTMTGDITTPGSLTAGKITDGKVTITKGTIQKGASEIDLSKEENPDLGLYSQEEGKWVRFVSNKGDFFFSSAGQYGNGSDPLVKIDPQGNLTAKGGLTVTGNTQLKDLNVSGNLNLGNSNVSMATLKIDAGARKNELVIGSQEAGRKALRLRDTGDQMDIEAIGSNLYINSSNGININANEGEADIYLKGKVKITKGISCGGNITIKSSRGLYLSNAGDKRSEMTALFKDAALEHEYMTLEIVSTREKKENITSLSAEEAIGTIDQLTPVKYDYKIGRAFRQNLGFIAEEMPENLASEDRKTISPFEVIPILTKVLQEHQKTIAAIQNRLNEIK